MNKLSLPTGYQFVNLANRRYGRLFVVEYVGKTTKGKSLWLCICDCGEEKIIRGGGLKNGTRSCGCLQKELAAAKTIARCTTHGRKNTPEYRSWLSMMNRCADRHENKYPNYSGRGIKVCDRWKSFENFFADMGVRPKGKTLDRINNDGNYDPSNCRWATRREQNINTSRNIKITLRGETLTISEWAERLGVKYSTLHSVYRRKVISMQQFMETVWH